MKSLLEVNFLDTLFPFLAGEEHGILYLYLWSFLAHFHCDIIISCDYIINNCYDIIKSRVLVLAKPAHPDTGYAAFQE